MLLNAITENFAGTGRNRRQNDRIAGPFDGFRIGALETPLRIFDLSLGGCFVNSMHEQQPGVRFQMVIDLPDVGRVTLNAQTLYRRDGYGFAVRFVDPSDETMARLELALDQLLAQTP